MLVTCRLASLGDRQQRSKPLAPCIAAYGDHDYSGRALEPGSETERQ